MGDIAEGLINGDFDEETGEYIGPGQGFPRSFQRENREKKKHNFLPTLKAVQKILADNQYVITIQRPIDYGTQLRVISGAIINIYTSGKICLQGKPDDKLKQLLK